MSHLERLKNRLEMAQAMLHGSILDEEDLLCKQQMVDEIDSQIQDLKTRTQALDAHVAYLRKHVLVECCKVLASIASGKAPDWSTVEDFAEKLLFTRGEQDCLEQCDL